MNQNKSVSTPDKSRPKSTRTVVSNQISQQAHPFESKHQFVIFIIFIAILGSFSSLVNDMYLPTIPAMMQEFHTVPSMTQLGISATMLGLGIGSVVWGSISDKYGRNPILIVSLVVFALFTAAALLSASIGFFIACRLFQGVGAGGSMVLSFSIPADRYNGRKLAIIMSIIGAINGCVPAAAPLVGGFMAHDWGWRGIFLLLLGIGIAMCAWATRRPESLPPQRRIHSVGIKGYIAEYITLLKNRRFMLYVLLKSSSIGLLFAYISASPFIVETHYGLRPSHFGMLFAFNSLFIILGSVLVPKFKEIKHALMAGGIIMCCGAVSEAISLIFDGGLIAFEACIVAMLLGSGMVFSTSNALAMEMGRTSAGAASAILNVVKYVFAAVVTPLVGLGDIMHSTAIGFLCITAVTAIIMLAVRRIGPLPAMQS